MWISWLAVLLTLFNGGTPPASATPVSVLYHPLPEQWMLNGIELGDEAYQVNEAWGRPSEVVADDWQKDCETWNYSGGKKIGLCNGEVSFVQIMAKAQSAVVDGKVIAMKNVELRHALGKPEFLADDGWGVLRGAEALKVFVDAHDQLVSLDLFLGPCSE
jgi:hypothetical protein